MPLLSVMRWMTGINLTVALKPRALIMALTTSENRACKKSYVFSCAGCEAVSHWRMLG